MYPGDYDDEEEFDESDMSDTGEGAEEEPEWNGHYGGGTGEEDADPEENGENGEQDDSGEGDGYGKDIGDGYGEDQNPDGGENPEEEGQEENNQKKNQDEQDVEVEGSFKKNWQKRQTRALIRRNAHKYATVMGILPIGCKPESIPCPGCGEKSIYRSKTLTDMFIFRVVAPIGNVYMCMNSGKNCKCSFERGKCWMTNGPFSPLLQQVPYPLKLLRFQK